MLFYREMKNLHNDQDLISNHVICLMFVEKSRFPILSLLYVGNTMIYIYKYKGMRCFYDNDKARK